MPTYLRDALVKIVKVASDLLVIFDYSNVVPGFPLPQGFLEIVQDSANTIM